MKYMLVAVVACSLFAMTLGQQNAPVSLMICNFYIYWGWPKNEVKSSVSDPLHFNTDPFRE